MAARTRGSLAHSGASTQAGPSNEANVAHQASSPAICSFREIHDHLEGVAFRHPASVIQDMLVSRKVQLSAGIEAFSKPTEQGKKRVHSGSVQLPDGTNLEVDEVQRELCDRISELHEIDHVDALVLLRSFLDSDQYTLDALTKFTQRHAAHAAPAATGATGAPPTSSTLRQLRQRALGIGQDAKEARARVLEAVLDSFHAFYFEERLCVLRCLATLLQLAVREDDDLNMLAETLLDGLATQALARRCMDQFLASAQQPLPEHIRDTPRYAAFWAKQRIKEQIALLEVAFLLHYERLRPSASTVTRVLHVAGATDFGRRQACEGYLDAEAVQLVKNLGYLLLLLSAETLDLESLMTGVSLPRASEGGSESNPQPSLLESPKELSSALNFLERTGVDPLRSPLLLAWALLLNRLDLALDEWRLQHPDQSPPANLRALEEQITPSDATAEIGSIWTALVNAALSPAMGLFETLRAIVRSPLVSLTSQSRTIGVSPACALAHRAVLKSLVLSVTELVRPEFIPDLPGLVSVWEATFSGSRGDEEATREACAMLSQQFWELDTRHDSRSALLATLSRRWPVSFQPLLRLLRALSGVSALSVAGSEESDPARSRDGLGPIESSPAASAAVSVFTYLRGLTNIAQAMPATQPKIGAPFELVEGDDGTFVHRATRDIPLFASHRVPKGSLGSVVSDEGHTLVIMWRLEEPISGWHLACDVLASLAGLLPFDDFTLGSAAGADVASDDGDIFDDRGSSVTDFRQLAPAEDATPLTAVAAEILRLFLAVMSANRDLSFAVLEHLREDVEDLAPGGIVSEALAQRRDLFNVGVRILDRALVSQPPDLALVRVGYQLLGHLAPLAPAEVWLVLRSSNVLTGSAGVAPTRTFARAAVDRVGLAAIELDASNIPTSTLLAGACQRGDYSALLALLDLTHGLVTEALCTQFSASPQLARVKVDSLLRVLSWIMESVWMEYQSWRYARLSDQIAIGVRCSRIWATLLSDHALDVDLGAKGAGVAVPPHAELALAVERALVTNTTLLHLAPLETVLGTARPLMDQLRASQRFVESEQVETLLLASLDLALAIAARRQHSQQRGRLRPGRLCMLEQLFFLHPSSTSGGMAPSGGLFGSASRAAGESYGSAGPRHELAASVLDCALLPPLRPHVKAAAMDLLAAVCRATVDAAEGGSKGVNDVLVAPRREESMGNVTLGSHLGTTSEILGSLTALLDVAENPYQDTSLRAKVWMLLAVMVETQPILATLLLTGRQLHADVEASLSRNANGGASTGALDKNSDGARSTLRTALDSAALTLDAWQQLWIDSPTLLEAAMRFLTASWPLALQHEAAFAPVRSRASLWSSLLRMATEPLAAPDMVIEGFEVVDGVTHTTEHSACVEYCRRALCRARALEIFAKDLALPPPRSDVDATSAAKRAHPSASTVASLFADAAKLSTTVADCVSVACDPELHDDVEQRLAATFPEIPLAQLRTPRPRGLVEPDRSYGDAYVYDVPLLHRKLEGFLTNPEAADGAGGEGTMDVDAGIDEDTLRQALLLVASLNLDWSIVDVQVTTLRVWTRLLEASQARSLGAPASAQMAARKGCLEAFQKCAAITVGEHRRGTIPSGVHAERVSLLAILVETAWPGHAASDPVGDDASVENALGLACQLLHHDVFSVTASLKGSIRPPFHRDVLRVVLFCLRRCRHLSRPHLAQERSDGSPFGRSFSKSRSVSVGPSQHRSLHQAVDSLASGCISMFRCAVDVASVALVTAATSRDAALAHHALDAAQDDVILAASVLELLSRSDLGLVPHFWASQLEQSALLPAMTRLLARVPISASQEQAALLPSSHRPALASALVSLLFALASQPVTCEQLVYGGVMTSLCSNALTPALEVGALMPVLINGSPSLAHACWVSMLRVVSALASSVGSDAQQLSAATAASRRFVEAEVTGFAQLYSAQVRLALDFRPLGLSRSELDRGLLSVERMEELLASLELFCAMTRATTAAEGSSSMAGGAGRGGGGARQMHSPSAPTQRQLAQFATQTAALLQQCVYLVQHPKELSVLVLGGQLPERAQAAGGSGNDMAGGREGREWEQARQLRNHVEAQVRDAAMLAVTALAEWSGAADVMCADRSEWPGVERILIAPTLRTNPGAPTSIGTLLDLITHLSERWRTQGVGSDPSSTADRAAGLEGTASAVEQAAALVASQLALCLHAEALSPPPPSSSPTESATDPFAAAASSRAAEPTAPFASNATSSTKTPSATTAKKPATAAKLNEARSELEAGLRRDIIAVLVAARDALGVATTQANATTPRKKMTPSSAAISPGGGAAAAAAAKSSSPLRASTGGAGAESFLDIVVDFVSRRLE